MKFFFSLGFLSKSDNCWSACAHKKLLNIIELLLTNNCVPYKNFQNLWQLQAEAFINFCRESTYPQQFCRIPHEPNQPTNRYKISRLSVILRAYSHGKIETISQYRNKSYFISEQMPFGAFENSREFPRRMKAPRI